MRGRKSRVEIGACMTIEEVHKKAKSQEAHNNKQCAEKFELATNVDTL